MPISEGYDVIKRRERFAKSIVVYDVTYDVTYDVIDDVIKVGTPNKNMFWKPLVKTQI